MPGSVEEAFDRGELPGCGHFGRADLDTPWEREDLVAALRESAARPG